MTATSLCKHTPTPEQAMQIANRYLVEKAGLIEPRGIGLIPEQGEIYRLLSAQAGIIISESFARMYHPQ